METLPSRSISRKLPPYVVPPLGGFPDPLKPERHTKPACAGSNSSQTACRTKGKSRRPLSSFLKRFEFPQPVRVIRPYLDQSPDTANQRRARFVLTIQATAFHPTTSPLSAGPCANFFRRPKCKLPHSLPLPRRT